MADGFNIFSWDSSPSFFGGTSKMDDNINQEMDKQCKDCDEEGDKNEN